MGIKKDATKAQALIRDEKALAMRLDHKTHEQINVALGYGSRQNVSRALKRRIRALADECAETAEAVKAMELARLDAMAAGLWKKATKGDTAAVAHLLKIQERRSAYEGLDMPRALKVEVARELDSNLEKLKAGLAPDVYEQVLGVLAGEHGAAEAGADPSGTPEGDDRAADEPRRA
jgi:hypothetical protein